MIWRVVKMRSLAHTHLIACRSERVEIASGEAEIGATNAEECVDFRSQRRANVAGAVLVG